MSKRNGDAKINTTPKKTSRFSRLPSHKSSPTKEPKSETVTFDNESVPMEGKAMAYMGAYYLIPTNWPLQPNVLTTITKRRF